MRSTAWKDSITDSQRRRIVAKELGGSVIVEEPKLVEKGLQNTIGIRERIPSKTIGAAIPRLLAKTKKLLVGAGVGIPGRPFFRFHSINMGVEYDLEVGYLCTGTLRSIEGLTPNVFPAGKYVTLKYAGKNRGYQGSKALIEWARANGHDQDRWDTELGDTFRCRFEVFISDIDTEPDHRKWIKEVAILVR
jgi:hypothetical protein